MSPRITRRGFLIGLGSAAAALIVRSEPWRALVAYRDPPAAARLVSLLTHVENARVVGHAYLRAFPLERSADGLVEGIASGLPGGHGALRTSSDDELRRAVSTAIRDDFAREADVTVQGWILSRTEARLYALAALF